VIEGKKNMCCMKPMVMFVGCFDVEEGRKINKGDCN